MQCSACTCAFAEGVDVESANETAFVHGENDESVTLYRQWANERLSTLLKFCTGGKLLEFGPGTGEFMYSAATKGFRVTGVDRFPRLREENNHPDISMFASDARCFHTEERFDAVAALHVLEHFTEPYDFLDSVRQNLVDGGLTLIEVPNYSSVSRVATGRRWNCFVSYHALQFTPASLERLLKKAGFEVLQLESVGCATTQVLGLGIPWFCRRVGLQLGSAWQPWAVLTPLATHVERRLQRGNNLRVVARKV